ncbi:MAG: hypothetical protein JKY98_07865, partial [Gammaproteobacteria bacterium]|nr:hypothetical protein [Gammaproteobacteria bacterium]
MSMTVFLVPALVAIFVAVITYFLAHIRFSNQARELAVLSERLEGKGDESAALAGEISRLTDKNADLGESSIRLREQISRLQGDLSNEQRQFEQKLALLENAREQMNLQFKELANEILEDKSKKFTATNQENISQILKPLQEKIQHFEKRVEETYDRESKE